LVVITDNAELFRFVLLIFDLVVHSSVLVEVLLSKKC